MCEKGGTTAWIKLNREDDGVFDIGKGGEGEEDCAEVNGDGETE